MTPEEAGRVLDQAQRINDLTGHHGWQTLVSYVDEMVEAKRRAILSGSCTSFDEYRRMTGWLDGAQYVLGAAARAEASARYARGVIDKGA
jgi:hypothetical protein